MKNDVRKASGVPTEATRNPNLSTDNQPKGAARRPSDTLDREPPGDPSNGGAMPSGHDPLMTTPRGEQEDKRAGQKGAQARQPSR